MNWHPLAVIAVALVCVGCAGAPVNPPLQTIDRDVGYRFGTLEMGPRNSDDVFVVVAVSGGGLRAAALAYGVLSEMDRFRFGVDQRSLLDEVDVISTVSVSSLVSGYYATFGQEQFLKKFPEDVLQLNIESAYRAAWLNPLNWLRMSSYSYSRSDLFAEYLDREIFHHKRFSDVVLQRPFVVISAMDLALGTQFSFDQDYFDHLCSDLDQVGVARAVTSSLAVPGLFAPIRLTNYDKEECSYEAPAWLVESELAAEPGSRAALEARTWREYEDADRRKYVHLVDGAFADRLAIRPIERALSSSRGPWSILTLANLGKISKIVVISIDASLPGARESFPEEPSFFRALTAASNRASEIYASDVSELLRLSLSSWQFEGEDTEAQESRMIAQCNALAIELCETNECQERTAVACYQHFAKPGLFKKWPEIYSINIGLESLADPQDRHWVAGVRGLQLPKEDTEKLFRVGADLLQSSPPYQRLIQDLRTARSE